MTQSEIAIAYSNSGLNVIPILTDGSKRPRVKWSKYIEQRTTEKELTTWFKSLAGYGIITGKISGNLEVIDFDDPRLIPLFIQRCEEAGQRDLLQKLVHVSTPSEGLHLYYHCEVIEGNQKLAMRPSGLDEKGRQLYDTLIETRGEGGYVLAPGSPAACHPSGKHYAIKRGHMLEIKDITVEERTLLLTIAREFDERVTNTEDEGERQTPSKAVNLDSESASRPGDDFNARADWTQLLTEAGWTYIKTDGEEQYWKRPGNTESEYSATVNYKGSDCFKCFSTSTPFETDKGYTKFDFYTKLYHNGNFSAAARALKQKGYGVSNQSNNAQNKNTKKPESKPKSANKVPEAGFAYQETNDGVFYVSSDPEIDPLWICSPLRVIASTCDEQSTEWGRLLEFMDIRGKSHRWAMPMKLMAGSGDEYRAQLLSQGLRIAPGTKARSHLHFFISNANPEKTIKCVSRTGWVSGADDRASFVLPNQVIGIEADNVIYQSDVVPVGIEVSGTVEEWKNTVGGLCVGNSRLVLAACIAFAGPLLYFSGLESGGFHLRGASSVGKTSILFVAASVFGGHKFLKTWRTTSNNGIEATAQEHSDLPLCLDELAQVSPQEVGEIAYLLANGTGKRRAFRSGQGKPISTWRLLFLSSGEIALSDHLALTGKRATAGQEVRLLDIPADAGVGHGAFENLHDVSEGGEFSRMLQEATARCFGAPGLAFITALAECNQAELRAYVQKSISDFVCNYCPADADGQVRRACERFALVATAGEIATRRGITGWSAGEALRASQRCFEVWRETRGGKTSTEEINLCNTIRSFLERYGSSRFTSLSKIGDQKDDERVTDRAGFKRRGTDDHVEYLLLPESFKSILKGFDINWANKTLIRLGWLRPSPDGKASRPERCGELGTTRVYVIKAASVFADQEKGDA